MKKTFLCLAALLLLGAGCTSSFPFFHLTPQEHTSVVSPTETPTTPSPTAPVVPAGWRTYENLLHGFSFSYPPGTTWNMSGYNLDDTPASFDLGTQVTATSAQSVPTTELAVRLIPANDPRIKNCFFSESRWPEEANGIATSHVSLGGRDVCLAVEQDAGAGNYYSSYAYSIPHGDEYIVLDFVVHSVNCLNYEDPATQCVAFDEARDTKGFGDIVGTLGFTGNAPKTLLDTSLFKEVAKTDKTNAREITLSYPHLEGYSDLAAQTEFNRLIDAKVNAVVAQFKTDAGDVSAEELDSALGPWTLFVDYQVYPAPYDRVSVVLEWSEYTGGAHPNSFYETLIFNLKTGKEEKLADLFVPGIDYLKTVSDLSITELTHRNELVDFTDSNWIIDGAGPKADNFAASYLSDSGLVVIFGPYQVAAYAAGPSEVVIPYSALQGKLAL